jgi:hypothetical protein
MGDESANADLMQGGGEAGMAADAGHVSRGARWAGWGLSGLAAVFLALDGAMKLAKPEPVLKGTFELGFDEGVIIPLGIVLVTSVVLYVIPYTAVLGAILLTGYLGGAVATQVRVGNPLFSHVLFPVYLGILIWAGLYLRDRRIRAVLPRRNGGGGKAKG